MGCSSVDVFHCVRLPCWQALLCWLDELKGEFIFFRTSGRLQSTARKKRASFVTEPPQGMSSTKKSSKLLSQLSLQMWTQQPRQHLHCSLSRSWVKSKLIQALTCGNLAGDVNYSYRMIEDLEVRDSPAIFGIPVEVYSNTAFTQQLVRVRANDRILG